MSEVTKPQPKFGWPPVEPKDDDGPSWLQDPGSRAIPKTKKIDREAAEKRGWLIEDQEEWKERLDLRSTKDRYQGNEPELLTFEERIRQNPAPLPPNEPNEPYCGHLQEGLFSIDEWQKRKPLRSAWCNRANNAILKTGARAAISPAGVYSSAAGTIVVK